MPMVRAMRMLNAIEAGALSGAQLETLLTGDSGRLAELNVLLGMRGQTRRMAASATAMGAVMSSARAMNAVAASATAMSAVMDNTAAFSAIIADTAAMNTLVTNADAMDAVAASASAMNTLAANSNAMATVWASNTAADAVLASATARLAVYNSDVALAALQATPAQVQRKVANGAINASTTTSTFVFVPNGTKVILLRRYYSGTEHDMIDWERGSTSDAAGQGPSGGGRNLDTRAQALGCVPGTYTSNGAVPTSNDATGNFVAAANGLRRFSWSANGAALYVSYILVG